MRRVLFSLVLIGVLSTSVFGLTRAFFSDSEISQGNILGAGDIDLLVTNTSYYNGLFNQATSWTDGNLVDQLFFNFPDLKPSDWGEDTIAIQVDTNDAWACYDINVTSNDDNGNTEPELLVDDLDIGGDFFDGELAGAVNFSFWIDDGDNVYEDNEIIITSNLASDFIEGFKGTFADSDENIFTGNGGDPLIGQETYFIGKYWCFGDSSPDPVTQDTLGFLGEEGANGPDVRGSGFACDGSSLDNSTQTDILTGDINFTAIQHRNNPNFQCPKGIDCNQEQVFLSEVISSDQGLRKNGTAVNANRSIPDNSLGAPEGLVNPPEWFTLGFGGSITTKFPVPVGDGPGDDLIIHEVTGGRATYPEELAKVEVSLDGIVWYDVGTASSTLPNGELFIDIASIPTDTIQYIRVTDVSDPGIHNSNADGFDLDAIEAIYGDCQVDEPEIITITSANAAGLGWGFADETPPLPAPLPGPFGSFVLGPDTPILGSGSINLIVDDTQRHIFGTPNFNGTRLDSINALTYNSYQASGSANLEISLQFNIDYDVTDVDESWQGRLVFEPVYNGDSTSGSWQSWDAASGDWWATGAPGSGLCPQGSPCSLSTILSSFPDAGIHNTLGAFFFKAGGPWTGGFDGNVDGFTMDWGGTTTTYDFEI